MSEQDQPSPNEDDQKRKLEDMKDDGGTDKPNEETLLSENSEKKKIKTADSAASTTASSQSPPASRSQEVTLIAEQVYRIQSTQLGNFLFRAGHMPTIHVIGASVTVSDLTGNVIFSAGGTPQDRVEVRESKENGTTTVHLVPDDNEQTGSSAEKVDEEAPLQIVAIPTENISISGTRPAVVSGNGKMIIYDGPKEVIVNGNVETIWNAGTGTITINGSVVGDRVLQTGLGNIRMRGDFYGVAVDNNGGGRVECSGSMPNPVVIDGSFQILPEENRES